MKPIIIVKNVITIQGARCQGPTTASDPVADVQEPLTHHSCVESFTVQEGAKLLLVEAIVIESFLR